MVRCAHAKCYSAEMGTLVPMCCVTVCNREVIRWTVDHYPGYTDFKQHQQCVCGSVRVCKRVPQLCCMLFPCHSTSTLKDHYEQVVHNAFPSGCTHTSLISLILEPPFPMREPHWLAGTTRRSVTGGLLVAGLLLIELMMSWKRQFNPNKCRNKIPSFFLFSKRIKSLFLCA